jgi:hypothetical protein
MLFSLKNIAKASEEIKKSSKEKEERERERERGEICPETKSEFR